MFSKIKDFLTGSAALTIDPDSGATERDLQIATGVLLLEMAGADDDYAPEEVQTIFAVMQKCFKIDEDEVLELLEAADSLRQEKQRVDEFVAAINDNFNEKQRQQILTMVWTVIHADGKVDKFEQRFAAQLKARLQLNDEQAEQAKKRGEAGRI